MNEDQILMVDTTKRILNDHCAKEVVDAAESGTWASSLWEAFESAGLSLANIPESLNGSGGQFSDSLLILREAAKFAAPIPLADTLIASTLLAELNVQVPKGPIGLGTGEVNFIEDPNSIHISGRLDGLAYGNECDHWLLVNQNQICLIDRQSASNMVDIQTHSNIAGEPYVNVLFNKNVAKARLFAYPNAMERVQQLGAITRVQLMSGAMSSILELTVQYALEREQFGRPIAQFQAIQQQLAVLAGEVSACQRAADTLLDASGVFNIAISKSRLGDAVAPVCEIAHQVHGAMGYTREHPLNLRSRRLWVWRDEYGEEVYWQHRLGSDLCMSGADSLWDRICDVD
ncbi:MAG: acyl-CoA dehydrogenase [Flavobacterium sp.]|jgi:acyl-CoA dehydrogenase